MLGDFNLLDLLTQGSTVTGSVLADNADFLGALGLRRKVGWMDQRGVGGKVSIPLEDSDKGRTTHPGKRQY